MTTGNKTVKRIHIDVDKCIGCRACEMACSAFHAKPRYSSVNPARSRVRVYFDEFQDIYVPVYSGNYVKTECMGRQILKIGDKTYRECALCRASCPSRDWFKEPDSGLPLKCDICEDIPPVEEPLCVKACGFGALSYAESEEERPQPSNIEELGTSIESLLEQYGMKDVTACLEGLLKRGMRK